MTDARTQAWLDQEDAQVTAVIRRYGLFIQYVGGGMCSAPWCDGGDVATPPFAYTVGLFGLNHPELLVFGVPPGTAAGVLNALGDRVRSGETLLPGQLITFEEWPHHIIPEHVPNPGEIVFSANRYYQRPAEASVPVLQLTYDDMNGRFPWEPGYAAPELQPRPGRFRADPAA
jgi:Domain of unknown function (DUF4262)